MFNLQHFAIHNVSSAILYGAIGIDLMVVRQNSYGFERSTMKENDGIYFNRDLFLFCFFV